MIDKTEIVLTYDDLDNLAKKKHLSIPKNSQYKFTKWLNSIKTDMEHQQRIEKNQKHIFNTICKRRGISAEFSEYFTALLNGEVRSINHFLELESSVSSVSPVSPA